MKNFISLKATIEILAVYQSKEVLSLGQREGEAAILIEAHQTTGHFDFRPLFPPHLQGVLHST